MTRRAVAFDRFAAFLAGLALTAFGALVIVWQRGVFGKNVAVDLTFSDALGRPWWPWASAGAGVVLVVLGLRWLATHRWPRKASRVALPGPGPNLTADASSVADAASAALKAEPAVLKASGTATLDRGTPTVTLTATVPAHRGLAAGVAAADRTAEAVGTMLGESVALRTVLHVDVKHGSVVR
ncbi:MAG TPA: hypothetical protein VJR50_24195 [Mycobacterium sp.]|nr:hypothetical protein [Mycobacterium sp.]